jgi:hypothetical protein
MEQTAVKTCSYEHPPKSISYASSKSINITSGSNFGIPLFKKSHIIKYDSSLLERISINTNKIYTPSSYTINVYNCLKPVGHDLKVPSIKRILLFFKCI